MNVTTRAAAAGTVGSITGSTSIAYVTSGGTYIIATHPRWTASGEPQDLVAILPAPLEGTRVLPLHENVSPLFIAELRKELDR